MARHRNIWKCSASIRRGCRRRKAGVNVLQRDCALPVEKRNALFVIWLSDDSPVGFSTSDKIIYGEQAGMHLHVTDPERRNKGIGAECVRRSADLYFERLKLKRLFCEPNAFNVAPNRALQKAGFKYLKTHKTVPSPLIFTTPLRAG